MAGHFSLSSQLYALALAGVVVVGLGGGADLASAADLLANDAGKGGFVENKGQRADDVLFTSWRAGALYQVKSDGLEAWTVAKRGAHEPSRTDTSRFAMKFLDATSSDVYGEVMLPVYHNYFIGRDAARWATRVPVWERVIQTGVMAGVEVDYEVVQGDVKCAWRIDLAVAAESFRIRLSGIDSVREDRTGAWVAYTPAGTARGERTVLSSRPEGSAEEPSSSQWQYDPLDRSVLWTIRPRRGAEASAGPTIFTIVIGLQGSGDDRISGVESDASGNFYAVGMTDSPDFHHLTPPGSYQPFYGGDKEVFVARYDNNLSEAWWTFLGGNGEDKGRALAVSPATGNLYVVGGTRSSNFPTTGSATDNTYDGAGDNAFVAFLSPDGTQLFHSTYFGGGVPHGDPLGVESDFNTSAYGVAADDAGNCYVTGGTSSGDDVGIGFGAYDSLYYGGTIVGTGVTFFSDVFVVKINPAGTALLGGTYVGGSGGDVATGIEVDDSGRVYVCGWTTKVANSGVDSTGYPASAGLYSQLNPASFVTRFAPDLTMLDYSYVRGGPNSFSGCTDLVLDSLRRVTVCGITSSTAATGGVGGFPTTPGALDSVQELQATEGFVYRVNAQGSDVDWATLLGWDGNDRAYGIALDPIGAPIVSGTSASDSFPLLPPGPHVSIWKAPPARLFVARLDTLGQSLTYTDLFGSRDVHATSGPDEQIIGSPLAVSGFRLAVGGYYTPTSGGSVFPYEALLFGLDISDLYSAMSFDSARTLQPRFAQLPPGSTKKRILTVVVETSGAASPLSVARFDFDMAGTTDLGDVANARMYFTGPDGGYDTTDAFGSVIASPGGSFSISGSRTLYSGRNYFHLAVDIVPGATPGNLVDVACNQVVFASGNAVPNPTSPVGAIVIGDNAGGYGGVAYVGDGGDFATHQEALDALLDKGLAADVSLRSLWATRFLNAVLISPSGQFRARGTPIHGATDKTLAIEGIRNGEELPEILFEATDSLANHVVYVNFPDPTVAVAIRDFKITAYGTTFGTAIELGAGQSNVEISDCEISSPPTNSNSLNQAVIRGYPPDGGGNENIQIKGCSITGGSTGIALYEGTSTIDGNVITGQSATGILVIAQIGPVITENYIAPSTQPIAPKALWLNGCFGAARISRNTVQVESGVGMLFQSCGIGSDTLQIDNNWITVFAEPYGTGFSLTNSPGPFGMYNNSVNVTSRIGSCDSAAAFAAAFTTEFARDNNVFANACGGFAEVIVTTFSALEIALEAVSQSDYNDLYTSGPILASLDGVDMEDLDSLRTATGQETSSLSIDPGFVSSTDLHTTAPELVGSGTFIPGIVVDHDGNPIDSLNPSIGAGAAVSTSVKDPDGTTVPLEFSLGPNFPNPFNAATEIEFRIPAPGHVKLDVFNILGQRVVTLVDEDRPAGRHTALWNGTNGQGRGVSSGVYLYRLTFPNGNQTRKMVLLK